MSPRWSALRASAGLLLVGLLPQHLPAQTITWVKFDNLAAGTRLKEQYAAQGIHFLNDYPGGGGPFRASPVVTATGLAWSAPHVLVNTAADAEIYSSVDVPLVIWFDHPVDGIGVRLGLPPGGSAVSSARVALYDCGGNLRGSTNAVPSATFTTAVEVWDVTGKTTGGISQLLVISHGASNVPEAIDDFSVQMRTGGCVDTGKPSVTITSHNDQEVVPTAGIVLQGTVSDGSSVIRTFRINGQDVPLTPHTSVGGALTDFTFRHQMTLQPGSNPITAMAWDRANNTGKRSIVLHYGAPATIALSKFHLTQRGIMQDVACDASDPMVAGKFTIARIQLDARTAGGATTYVHAVEMTLYRRVGGVDQPVDTYWGTTYSPFVSLFDSPSELAGIHFWIPPEAVATAGEYRMRFQPYLGITPVGAVLDPPCGGTYFTFQDTNPIRVLLVPAEVSLADPILGAEHFAAHAAQLDEVIRTHPVRAGISSVWSAQSTGLKIGVSDPLKFCDGSAGMQSSSKWCGGTGFTWTFRDANSNGLWRASHAQALDPTRPDCIGSNRLGGRITSAVLHNLPASPIGYFRGGAHPGDGGGDKSKYYMPFDDDRDGTLEAAELANYAAEYLDAGTGQWSTDFNQYAMGDVFRQFRDLNGNNCYDEGDSEPVAPVVTLWRNVQTVLFPSARDALETFNKQNPSVAFQFGYLLFPEAFNPWRPDFSSYGPGSANGNVAWIRVGADTAMTHELGHNVAGLGDLYYSSTPEAQRRVPHWAAYAYYNQVTNNVIYGVMNSLAGPNRNYFKTANYQSLFDKVKTGGSLAASSGGRERAQAAFRVAATLAPDGTLASLSAGPLMSDTFTEEDPFSAYHLRVGTGESVLADHGIPIAASYPIDGEDLTLYPPDGFDMTVPLPEGTEWYEIRRDGLLLHRGERSGRSPVVAILYPNGRETFGPEDLVPIEWAAEDDDGNPLTFEVLYSPDNGTRWHVIATGVTSRFFEWDTRTAPGGSEALVRVVANDGFNTGQDDSDDVFRLEGKPPSVAILSPREGQLFLEYERIPLRGFATDPEGGNLDVYWDVYGPSGGTDSYDLEGLVGPLPPGEYTAELTVIDPDGAPAVAGTWFLVLADSDGDGMTDEYEETEGFDPGLAADALDDQDEDDLANFDESWRGTGAREWDSDGDGVSDGEEVRRGSDPRLIESVPVPSSCEDAMAVAEGTYFGSIVGAEGDGASSCGNAAYTPDVFCRYTAQCDGELYLTTCGSAFDTVLSVHTECPATPTNEVACNDDCGGDPCGGRDSCLAVPVEQGGTYWIRVSGYGGTVGDFALNVAFFGTSPENDFCESAVPISDGVYEFSTCVATTDGPDEPLSCDYYGYSDVGSDIWYCYAPECSGTAVASLCGSVYDTKIAVYEGCGCPPTGARLACNDDACGVQSEVVFPVQAGGEYMIRIGGYRGERGAGVLVAECMPGPFPVIFAIEPLPGGDIRVMFEEAGAAAAAYGLEHASDPTGPWDPEPGAVVVPVGGGAYEVIAPAGPDARRFFRVGATP